jgi:hypothetical protein
MASALLAVQAGALLVSQPPTPEAQGPLPVMSGKYAERFKFQRVALRYTPCA